MSDLIYVTQRVDGFSYNASLLYQTQRYWPQVLAQMDVLRRANNYRPRWFTITEDIGEPIQPYDTFYQQIEVADGSYLWGYNFSSLSAVDQSGAPAVTTAADLCIQATDSCTGIPIFQDFVSGGGCHTDFSAGVPQIALSQARLILTPGQVNVEIANRTANLITCQLVIYFAEPCRVVEDR